MTNVMGRCDDGAQRHRGPVTDHRALSLQFVSGPVMVREPSQSHLWGQHRPIIYFKMQNFNGKKMYFGELIPPSLWAVTGIGL
jgi:hypothetical protein